MCESIQQVIAKTQAKSYSLRLPLTRERGGNAEITLSQAELPWVVQDKQSLRHGFSCSCSMDFILTIILFIVSYSFLRSLPVANSTNKDLQCGLHNTKAIIADTQQIILRDIHWKGLDAVTISSISILPFSSYSLLALQIPQHLGLACSIIHSAPIYEVLTRCQSLWKGLGKRVGTPSHNSRTCPYSSVERK